MQNPTALTESEKANFEQLKRAASYGDLALVRAHDTKTGELVALVCAVTAVHDNYTITPFAQLLNENPYARFTIDFE